MSPGVRLSEATTARLSGGVCLLINTQYTAHVKPIHTECDNCVVLKLSKDLTGLATDCILLGMYLPPAQSLYYAETEIDNGVSLLEFCLLDVIEMYGDLPVIVCGDFNARTGTKNGKVIQLPDEIDDIDNTEDQGFTRTSKDETINEFGRYLLNVCDQFNLVILNGSLPGDKNGNFTYLAHNGSSVIDYFIMSRSIAYLALSLYVNPRIESKHMPVEMRMKLSTTVTTVKTLQKIKLQKYVWNNDKAEDYVSGYSSQEVLSMIESAVNLIDVNVSAALTKFNESIYKAGQCMQKTIILGNDRQNAWFDGECHKKRKLLRQLLRKFRRTKNAEAATEARIKYTEERKQYKNVLKQKKTAYKQRIIDTLDNSIKDPKTFWRTVKSVARNVFIDNKITADIWYDHFKNLFDSGFPRIQSSNTDTSTATVNEIDTSCDISCDSLDCDISAEEVQQAVSALNNNKAAGPDGLIGEFYKYSPPCIIIFLTKYFNKLFELGQFPDEWLESIIQPVYKKGDPDSPDNYRGISLLNICGKIYSYILNKRLMNWVEDNDMINEAQAGFRRNYSTIDHIFTLLALVQKQLLNHSKLYVAFIDFKKAFDLVDRSRLWEVLQKNNVKGRMYRAIKSMYEVVKARVRVRGGSTDAFLCPRGLKQGDICSPILFSLLINELANDIMLNGKHGITLAPDIVQILIMLFADDVILMSYTVVGLQHQLNTLNNSATNLGLFVNFEKSKVVVFRNGGYIASREKWFYDGVKLEVVNQYKYLGVIFSTGLTFSYALEDMATKAKKGIVGILKLLWTLNDQTPKLFFKLFDTQIQPILTYGSEVWALMVDHSIIEKVHTFALKRFLNVSKMTPNTLVYSETGRYPLYVNTYSKCIKYWLNLLRMPEKRLPLKSYKMLYNLHCNNKKTWVSNVCYTLYRYGFGHVWENQGVADIKRFLSAFKQRLIDCYLQDWHGNIGSKERYSFYSSFTSVHGAPYQIYELKNIAARKSLIRFRLGVSALRTHRLRYTTSKQESLSCPFCVNTVEDELHFLFICPQYQTIRNIYIPTKFSSHPSAFRAALLMASTKHTKALATYLHMAFEKRNNGIFGNT